MNGMGFGSGRFLPVEIAGRLHAFPMETVAAVRRLSQDSTDAAPAGVKGATVPVIDLRHLLFPQVSPPEGHYIVVISTPHGAVAMLVDTVRPVYYAPPQEIMMLPNLVTRMRCPFRSAIRTPQGVMLVIQADVLVRQIREAMPELDQEGVHVLADR